MNSTREEVRCSWCFKPMLFKRNLKSIGRVGYSRESAFYRAAFPTPIAGGFLKAPARAGHRNLYSPFTRLRMICNSCVSKYYRTIGG